MSVKNIRAMPTNLLNEEDGTDSIKCLATACCIGNLYRTIAQFVSLSPSTYELQYNMKVSGIINKLDSQNWSNFTMAIVFLHFAVQIK